MKYISCCSGGKDSVATVILAHENKEPLDIIIFVEVMFDKHISGELPEHIDFIKNKAFPLFESWGYETKILHADKTYMDIFKSETTRGKWFGTGLRNGFPMALKCGINKPCKIKPMKDFEKSIDDNITKYIGISIDEQKRLTKLEGNKVSLLAKYGYTEQMAFDLCKQYNLISPVYKFSSRNGCWFCPNARDRQLRYLRKSHPDLWQKLLGLEDEPNLIGNIWNALTKTTIHSKEEQFFWEEQQMDIFDFIL